MRVTSLAAGGMKQLFFRLQDALLLLREKTISIVDSWPHPEAFYQLSIAFLRKLAAQIDGQSGRRIFDVYGFGGHNLLD